MSRKPRLRGPAHSSRPWCVAGDREKHLYDEILRCSTPAAGRLEALALLGRRRSCASFAGASSGRALQYARSGRAPERPLRHCGAVHTSRARRACTALHAASSARRHVGVCEWLWAAPWVSDRGLGGAAGSTRPVAWLVDAGGVSPRPFGPPNAALESASINEGGFVCVSVVETTDKIE